MANTRASYITKLVYFLQIWVTETYFSVEGCRGHSIILHYYFFHHNKYLYNVSHTDLHDCHEVLNLYGSKILLQIAKNFNSSSQYPAIHCREDVGGWFIVKMHPHILRPNLKQSVALFKENFNFDHGNEGLNSQVNKSRYSRRNEIYSWSGQQNKIYLLLSQRIMALKCSFVPARATFM